MWNCLSSQHRGVISGTVMSFTCETRYLQWTGSRGRSETAFGSPAPAGGFFPGRRVGVGKQEALPWSAGDTVDIVHKTLCDQGGVAGVVAHPCTLPEAVRIATPTGTFC